MKRHHLVMFTLFLAACSGPTQSDPTPNNAMANNEAMSNNQTNNQTTGDGTPTYHGAIRSLIERNCIGCHDPGGIGPYELDTYESVAGVAELSLSAIENDVMPPWKPDPACRDFKNARILSDADREAFADWVAGGKPEGDPSEYVDPNIQHADLGEPDIVARPSGPFTPTVESGDEYRCFLLDAEFDKDTYVTKLNVNPGNRSLVHHSNMFLASAAHVATVEALEAANPGAGYPCFGDTGINTVNLIGAWVPGMEPIELPEGYAVRIPAGSRILMQTHFNSVYADLAEVSQEFQMWTRDTPPDKVVRAMPLANLNFVVPPGERESSQVMNIRYLGDEPLEVFGTAAHAHLLATQVKLEVLRPGGDRECLLDIPDWDFNWQQAYFYDESSWATVNPGDNVRLTCVFDNSPENQPQVDGMKITPREVKWGGETFDEMCVAFMIVAEDYKEPTNGDLCSEFKTCRETCDDPYSVGCVFNCAVEERNCGECLVFGAQDCGARHCPDELREASPCLLQCAQGAQAGGDIDQCLIDNCPDEREALETCMKPALETGLCNEDLRACNVEL